MNLKNQAVNSIKWTSLRTLGISICGPLLIFIQARYLTPAEFGVLAIINIIYGLLNVFENFGLSQAVIQRDQVSNDERSSLFFFEIIFCILITLVLVISTPFISGMFEMPSLNLLLPLLSIVVLINGPMLLFTAFLEKEFHFKELSIIQVVREFSMIITTFGFLYFGFGLTGIVLSKIIAVAIMVILIATISYKNNLLHVNFHFNFREVLPFIEFGIFVSLKQLLTNLTHHIDEIIIGYFLSAEILGLYHFAKNMIGRLRTVITTSFSKVLFPLLSKVKNDSVRLTKAYNNISKYIGVFTFPVFIGIALTAHLFVPLIFGVEWTESVPFFQILAITFIPYVLTANLSTSLLYSVGKPSIALYVDLVINAIYIVLLITLSFTDLGIYPVIFLYSLYIFIKTFILQYITSKYLHSTFRTYLYLFKKIVLNSLLMVFAVLILQNYINTLWIELILSVLFGGFVYFIGFYIFDKPTIKEIRNLLLGT